MERYEFSLTKAITVASLAAGLLLAVNSFLTDNTDAQDMSAPIATSLAVKS